MVDVADFLNNPKLLTGTLAQWSELEGEMVEAHVLRCADAQLVETNYDNWNGGTYTFRLSLCVPLPLFAKLGKDRDKIEAHILRKGQKLFVPYENDQLGSVLILPEIEAVEENHEAEKFSIPTEDLIREIESQRDMMIAVATGGPKIDTVNDEYRQRRKVIVAGLRERHLDDPNPYKDLWEWYGRWSSGDLPSWSSRRTFIAGLFSPALDRLANGPSVKRSAEVIDEPTGWMRVDRSMGEARTGLAEARNEEQYQAVGLMCRETLISLAGVVFDPAKHKAIDGKTLSETDAMGQLEAYLTTELKGSTNEVMRHHAKAALKLANELVHKRTAGFRIAALCAEATASVVNLVAIISGKRDPK